MRWLRLKPGVALLEEDLAVAYGVGRTPIREALAKPVEDGRVTVCARAGTFVSQIPFHDPPQALVVRRSIEDTGARLAAPNGGSERLAAVPATGNTIPAEAAGHPGLWLCVQQVAIQVGRLRRVTRRKAAASAGFSRRVSGRAADDRGEGCRRRGGGHEGV